MHGKNEKNSLVTFWNWHKFNPKLEKDYIEQIYCLIPFKNRDMKYAKLNIGKENSTIWKNNYALG